MSLGRPETLLLRQATTDLEEALLVRVLVKVLDHLGVVRDRVEEVEVELGLAVTDN